MKVLLSLSLFFFLWLSWGVSEDSSRCAPLTDYSRKQTRIAIAFFGISRNLQVTMPLFNKYMFNVLERNGILSDVFWHTVTKSSITNLHTMESNVALDRFDVRQMNPCVFELADEGLVKEAEFKKYINRKRLDKSGVNTININKIYDPFQKHFHDNYESLKNMLCAFYSQQRLSQMISHRMQITNMSYDAILALRPDTGLILKEIDLPQYLPKIRSGESRGVWTPNFQMWKGLNDRFAYGDVASMLLYLNRGDIYKNELSKLTKRNGEQYLKKYLEFHGVDMHYTHVRLLRVRANGVVAKKDCLEIGSEHGTRLQQCISWRNIENDDKECFISNIEEC